MRRKDREVTDIARIAEIINACEVCRIGMCDGDSVYIVPLNFGYTLSDGAFTFYFHGAGEGKKIDLLKQNPKVALEMDTGHQLVTGEQASSYSMKYRSVMAKGEAKLLEGEAKKEGLDILMAHYAEETGFTYAEGMLQKMSVIKVIVTEITGKEHI